MNTPTENKKTSEKKNPLLQFGLGLSLIFIIISFALLITLSSGNTECNAAATKMIFNFFAAPLGILSLILVLVGKFKG
ncbi:hypothetical protein KAR26_00520 [Candidatus Parcubacteria bacterium]|nr:hypothetical protein [Candidatus Parcubacteria bacterium]